MARLSLFAPVFDPSQPRALRGAWALLGLWFGLIGYVVQRVLRQAPEYARARLDPALTPSDPALVSIVVPARNEEAIIERCVCGLIDQTYPADQLEIIVVDDGSTDATARIVQRLAHAHPQVQLITADPIQPGWVGKQHACWNGAQHARGTWIGFVDADVTATPDLISAAVAYAQAHAIDLLSLTPRQQLGTLWERLALPTHAFMLSILAIDLRRVNDPHAPDAHANGQFLFFRRAAYDQIGGYATIKAEMLEDKALARVIKRSGLRLRLLRGEDVLHTRMYTGLASLWEGISKNKIDLLGGGLRTVWAAIVALLLGWLPLLLPAWAWRRGLPRSRHRSDQIAWAGVIVSSGTVLGAQAVAARQFDLPVWYAGLFPLAFTLEAAISLDSVRRRATGRTRWKGRVYQSLQSDLTR